MTKGVLFAAVIAAVGAGGTAFAQSAAPPCGPGGPGAGRVFDPKMIGTVSGEVAAVRKVEGRCQTGVHLDVKTGDALYDVHVGPASFLESKGLKLEKGDQVEVTGSKIDLDGEATLIAQRIKKGDATVTLRDASGIPAWSRRGSR